MLRLVPTIARLIAPYSASEYITTTHAIEVQLQLINPDLVVLDGAILTQAVDATVKLGLEYIFLSPNTWSTNAVTDQGLKALTWPM
jgi:hypothetical protein